MIQRDLLTLNAVYKKINSNNVKQIPLSKLFADPHCVTSIYNTADKCGSFVNDNGFEFVLIKQALCTRYTNTVGARVI